MQQFTSETAGSNGGASSNMHADTCDKKVIDGCIAGEGRETVTVMLMWKRSNMCQQPNKQMHVMVWHVEP
jgi:hypothetical protein